MKKALKGLKISLLALAVLLVVGFAFPTWTPGIVGENSVSSLGQVEINGAGHEVMIRGVDRDNPAIIFVHGGPGCSEIPYVRKYQDELEKHFTIVHYDQRGSGKSYHFFEDYSNLSSELLVEDLLHLTDYIREELNQDKVILIGHSFGTYLATQAIDQAPEKYHAYIGIGQMANTTQSEIDSWNFAMEQAAQAGSSKDVERLEGMEEAIRRGEELTPRDLVRKYGGAARLIDENKDYITGFLFNPEYNLTDVVRYMRGVSVTQEKLLDEGAKKHITTLVGEVDIPVYFVMGKYDYMTSVNAARAYFQQLDAPLKDFVIFENSAHYPQFEEEALFAQWLKETWVELNSEINNSTQHGA